VVPGVPTEKRDVILADEEGIRNAIKNVRSDSSGKNWVLVTYDAPKSKTLVLLGTGSGGISELVSYLKVKQSSLKCFFFKSTANEI
jgi:hypothetical protein